MGDRSQSEKKAVKAWQQIPHQQQQDKWEIDLKIS